MINDQFRVVLDSNIIISSLLFGGKPREIMEGLLRREFVAILSNPIISEITDVLRKKFEFSENKVKILETEFLDKFEVVYPSRPIKVVRDKKDDKILEAAIEGRCGFVVTGDKDLLVLKKYKNIKIVDSAEFLRDILS